MEAEGAANRPVVAAVAENAVTADEREKAAAGDDCGGAGRKAMADGRFQKAGTVVIVVIDLLENVAARGFDAEIEFGSGGDGQVEANVSDSVDSPAKTRA